MTISVAPNGIVAPGPFPGATEATDICLPFDGIPDSLEEFLSVLNDINPPTETTDTGLPFNSHPDNLEDFPIIVATSTGSNYRYSHRPTKRPLVAETTVDGAKRPKQTVTPTERPHRYGDRVPNYHPWNVESHRLPTHYPQEQQKGAPITPHFATDDVHPYSQTHSAVPTIPALNGPHKGGHGPVILPKNSSQPVIAPTPTASYSNLTGGPLHDHARQPQETVRPSVLEVGRMHPPSGLPRLISPRGLDTEDSTSSSSDLSPRDREKNEAVDGFGQNMFSGTITATIKGGTAVVEEVGDKYFKKHGHHSKKPHKPSVTPSPAQISNSTSAHVSTKEVATESNPLSGRQFIFQNTDAAQKNAMLQAFLMLTSNRKGAELTPRRRCILYGFLFNSNTTHTDIPKAREVAFRLDFGRNCANISTPKLSGRDVESLTSLFDILDTDSTGSNSLIDPSKLREALKNIKYNLQASNSTNDTTKKEMLQAVNAAIYVLGQAKPDNHSEDDDVDMTVVRATNEDHNESHLEKRQGNIFDALAHQDFQNRMRIVGLRAQLGDKADKKAMEELCKEHLELPDCGLVNEYVERKNKHYK